MHPGNDYYMKKVLLLLLVSVCGVVSAQRTGILSQIDSIYQQKRDSVAINLDSLANPKFENIKVKFKDTIVVRPDIVVPHAPQDLPLTPFNVIQGSAKKWFYFGQNTLVFNQSSFANWISGGNNNIGVIGKVSYNFIYKNKKHYLENIVHLGYGFIANDGESSKKTDDFINFMMNYGYELGSNYYLSAGFQFTSQFTPGYNYAATPNPVFNDRVSRFMAPGYLNVGVGISFNPKENFQVIFRPVNGKFTFVTDPLLQVAGRYGLTSDGQSVRSELGAMLNVLYRLKIYKGVNLDNQLNFFTNYLSHSERVDIAYNGTLNIKFNRFISTIVSLDMVYDHDQVARLQRKQTLSVGLSYNLGQNLDGERTKKNLKPFVN